MPPEYIVSGTILYGEDLEPREGYVVVSGRKIKEIGFERHDSEFSGVICPAFINAHTHVGDSIAKDLPYMPLVDLVAPPNGLKHKILNGASEEEIAAGIRTTLSDMRRTGTLHFIDFRENGAAGARLLRGIAGDSAMILGRLAGADTIDDVLNESDGLGISSTRDLPGGVLHSIVEKAKNRRKTVGIHAGELNRNDIDTAIDTMPDFLVHMTQAVAPDIKRTADSGIPVVVCPRSNAITGVGLPPVKAMRDAGVELALGTDNVMLNSADMFAEMSWVAKAFLHDDTYTLKMATLNGARLMHKEDEKGSVEVGKDADLLVINDKSDNLKGSKNVLSSVVRRARPDDISYFIDEGKLWRNYSRKY
jgi:cytosine/adenosine deaminase-related metal-dependent hydrolase